MEFAAALETEMGARHGGASAPREDNTSEVTDRR